MPKVQQYKRFIDALYSHLLRLADGDSNLGAFTKETYDEYEAYYLKLRHSTGIRVNVVFHQFRFHHGGTKKRPVFLTLEIVTHNMGPRAQAAVEATGDYALSRPPGHRKYPEVLYVENRCIESGQNPDHLLLEKQRVLIEWSLQQLRRTHHLLS